MPKLGATEAVQTPAIQTAAIGPQATLAALPTDSLIALAQTARGLAADTQGSEFQAGVLDAVLARLIDTAASNAGLSNSVASLQANSEKLSSQLLQLQSTTENHNVRQFRSDPAEAKDILKRLQREADDQRAAGELKSFTTTTWEVSDTYHCSWSVVGSPKALQRMNTVWGDLTRTWGKS